MAASRPRDLHALLTDEVTGAAVVIKIAQFNQNVVNLLSDIVERAAVVSQNNPPLVKYSLEAALASQ